MKLTNEGKIDTHHHFLPKVYVDAVSLETLASVMPSLQAPEWSVDLALAMMAENDIDEAILSISSGPTIPDSALLLRRCNEEAAQIRARNPNRFGSFASLPLPDIDASLREIAYALDTLEADGFIIFSNYEGVYPGDPTFIPLWEELNARKAVVLIHPNGVPYQLKGLPAASVLEFPFDTTRAAASLIVSGTIKRFADIRFILSHAGGTLPFLSQRIAGALTMTPAMAELTGDPLAAIRHFWFDTALSFSKAAMGSLMAVADPTRILFGTDFPMAPRFAIRMSAQGLAESPLEQGIRLDIGHRNAARLLGRT